MPSKYIKKGESPEGRKRRLRAFKHNGYMGHARLMTMQAHSIALSDTTTEDTKQIADRIAKLATKLEQSLSKRIDP